MTRGASNAVAWRRVQTLGRLKAGQMNKAEAAYAQHLEASRAGGGWEMEGF